MKFRPQLQLRLRDAAQFNRLKEASYVTGLSANEYICRAVEEAMERDLQQVQQEAKGG